MTNSNQELMDIGLDQEFSEAQKQIIQSRSSSICVAAAAGSGKTRVLIERYIHMMLERNTSPERIIAITFTNKAADEMKERLKKRFRKLSMDDQIEFLDMGQIATVHSFCLKLLKENAIEAGLDPSFNIIESELTQMLQRQIFDQLMEQIVMNDDDHFEPLFENASIEDIRESLFEVYSKWRSSNYCLHVPNIDVQKLMNESSRVIESCHAWLDSEHMSLMNPKNRDENNSETRTAINQIQQLLKHVKSLRKKRLAESKANYLNQLSDLNLKLHDLEAEPINHLFLELFQMFHHSYSELKDDRSLLDVDDQIQMVIELFKHPSFKGRFMDNYDVLMVDEFQDINPLQNTLFKAMSEGIESFYVGDVRQSIYRFRFASNSLFIQLIEQSMLNQQGYYQIQENYRSHPQILSFINKIYKDKVAGDQYLYGELLADKDDDLEVRNRAHLYLQNTGAKKLSVEQIRQNEARFMARQIKSIVNNDMYLISEGDHLRTLKYQDIAILFRKMTSLHIYENEFRKEGIPYHLTKGRGFYQKLEINDLVNVLKVLNRTHDTLSMACVLKSPLVGLTNDALYHLFVTHKLQRKDIFSLEALNIDKTQLSNDDKERFKFFVQWFRRLKEDFRTMGIAQIIHRIIEETKYEAFLLSLEDGSRRYLNVLKFKEKAKQFEGYLSNRLDLFLDLMGELVLDTGLDEAEASVVGREDDSVQVMTVHAAKGLEFPVVLVADMTASSNAVRSTTPFIMNSSGAIVSAQTDKLTGDKVKGLGLSTYLEAEEELNYQESLRLLYVALTRATDYLFCFGALSAGDAKSGENLNKISWIQFVLSSLIKGSEVDLAGEVECDGWRLHQIIPSELEKSMVLESQKLLSSKNGSNIRHVEQLSLEDKGNALELNPLITNLTPSNRPYFQTLDFTISQLSAFRFQIQKMSMEETLERSSVDGYLSPSRYGSIFHELLQHIDYLKSPEDEVDRLMGTLRNEWHPKSIEELKQSLHSFLQHPFVDKIREANNQPNALYRELPFLYRINDGKSDLGFIKGQVDLLFHEKGVWHLIDYKTSKQLSESHVYQLELYAFCLKQLLSIPIEKAYLYYSSKNEFVDISLNSISMPGFHQKLVHDYKGMMELFLGEST